MKGKETNQEQEEKVVNIKPRYEKKPTNNDNYTKTIIHELSKYEVDEKVVKIIEEVAQKIDNDYLGEAINNSPQAFGPSPFWTSTQYILSCITT